MPGLSDGKPLLLATVIAASVFSFAAGTASTNDALTGLPVYPGVTDPNPMPKARFCGKATEGDFYLVMGEKVDGVVEWYAKHLPGYKKYHSVGDNRTQDTFFSPDGLQQATITGAPKSPEVFSVSYGRFKPALSAPEMASFNTGKQVCK